MLSKFLPEDFDPSKPIGLIAGRGVYPKLLAENARAKGIEIRLIAFEDETRDDLFDSFPETHRCRFNVGQMGKWLKALRKMSCAYCVMAGQVTPKKLFRGLKPDLKAASMLLKLKRKNAESIFGAITHEIEKQGARQLDARIFLDEQLASSGWMTPQFEKIEEIYLRHGIEIATEMARLDIGQGVVVRKGTVIAVEAFEGTDPMLKRAGEFKTDHLIFTKTVKHRQDYRFDVPVFGLGTLEAMKDAGIRAAALKADSVIMLEKEATLAEAKKAKIQLFGF